jgi:hypothetical protein
MGHMPQGQVERTEDGKVFQHLIISVNSHLREVAFKARPKGYLPSEHRAIARQIVDLSSEDESGYTTPSYPELVTGAYDPMLAGWVRRDHSDLDQLYADHPEGLHPRHLLLRFDR